MKSERNFLRYLAVLLLAALTLPALAQQEEEIIEDSNNETLVADSAATDSLERDTTLLPWPQSMQHSIDKLLQNSMFETSQVGLMIYDLTADSVLYQSGARSLMRPASTMKLITAITAIDRLGGSYRLKTSLCYSGEVRDNVLYGDIYCVGGFDPRFNSDDLHAFVEAIHKMGVDTIRGSIYADKTMKDNAKWGEGWCWDDDNPTLSPLLISRKDNFINRFFDGLREAGIWITGSTGEARRPADANCIVDRFHTIDQILMPMLKESDNLCAEAMFYQIAASTGNRPASARSAKAVEQRLIRKIGLDPSHYRIADGSGLSLYNYVSAELEVRLLRYAWCNSNILAHLLPALPIAGVDGTLSKRMSGSFTSSNIKAKTGTLTGISSLAGYCRAANGHDLCFAIINQGVMHGRNGRKFQDKVCEAMCRP